MLLFWYFRTCPRKPLIVSLWGGAGRQAQITGIMMLVFDLGRFFSHPACLCHCSQHPMETPPGLLSQWPLSSLQPGVRELMAVHNFSKLSWGWGEGRACPTGTEPASLSTLCASTKLICLKETVVSSGEGPLSPHRSFLLCHSCLSEAVALHGQTGGGICEVRKPHLCSVREAKRFLEEPEWKIGGKNWYLAKKNVSKRLGEQCDAANSV